MSLLSKAFGKISKYLPAAAQLFPSSKALQKATGTLQTVGSVLSGVGLGAALGGPGAALPGPLNSAIVSQAGLGPLPTIGTAVAPIAAAGRALVPVGRQLVRRYGKKAMQALNLFAIGSIVYDAATGQAVGQRYTRKINPLNHKELRFAIRRVKASARIGRDIERVLGKGSINRLGRRC